MWGAHASPAPRNASRLAAPVFTHTRPGCSPAAAQPRAEPGMEAPSFPPAERTVLLSTALGRVLFIYSSAAGLGNDGRELWAGTRRAGGEGARVPPAPTMMPLRCMPGTPAQQGLGLPVGSRGQKAGASGSSRGRERGISEGCLLRTLGCKVPGILFSLTLRTLQVQELNRKGQALCTEQAIKINCLSKADEGTESGIKFHR